MLNNTLQFLEVFCVLFIFYIVYRLRHFGHRDKRLPPGPPTIPILGNAHIIPSHGLHLKFKEWSDQYGKVFSLKIGASTIIVLNDRRAVHELIDKKSAIYSERPFDQNTDDVTGCDNFGFMHATPRWRAQRKVAYQNMSPKTIDEKIAPIQDAEICQLVWDLLKTPDRFLAHVKRVSSSVPAIVIWGFRAPSADSFWGTCVYRVMDALNPALEPGSYLPVDQFPILKYVPDRWAPSKARAKQAYKKATNIWIDARKRVEARRQKGDERNSIADRLLSGDLKLDTPMTPIQLGNFFGVLHQAASDTTAGMIMTNILYLAKHPWVQDKATKELDQVCPDRMPTWNDFKTLPYINCIIKESMRVRPVVAAGVPHRVSCDDWFDGFLIPKDSTIFIPAYTLNLQVEDGEIYNPDRYLNHPKLSMDYAGSPDYENRDHYAYGSGRRICTGIHLADRTQWRIVAGILWGFRIEPAKDEAGNSVELDLNAYIDGFLTHPAPFKVRFAPRSNKHVEIMERDFRNVEDFLKKWE